jgi:alanine racemase
MSRGPYATAAARREACMSAKRQPLVWAEFDLRKLRRNLAHVCSSLDSPNIEVLAIVKADAYGHGMKRVAQTLASEGVDFFGVANIDEAAELRRVCRKARILVLGSFHPDQVREYEKLRIRPTVSSEEDLRVLQRRLSGARPFPVHIKIDTGMGRLGVWHEQCRTFFQKAGQANKIQIEGIYTHFANADHAQKSATQKQIRLFNAAVQCAKSLGIMPRYLHAANSMGVLRFREAHLNLVRPGIVLYGLNPRRDVKPPKGLEPVLTLKARISFLKQVEKDRPVSYGSTYVAPRKTRIATLPIGYSHGYRIAFSNKAHVLVKGVRCPVAGRVTMDQTLVDVGAVRHVGRWDEVVLIGNSGRKSVTAHELASLIGTISYEITCALHSRIPRIYK